MIRNGAVRIPDEIESLVDETTYATLLGYPQGVLPAGRARRLAAASRDWFCRNAAPWAHTKTLPIAGIEGEVVSVAEGIVLTSPPLAKRLRRASSDALIVAVVSAGEELDVEGAAMWQSDRPDEAYFLDRLGAAVTRSLAVWVTALLRERAGGRGLDVLPGSSPGFDGWPLTDQEALAIALRDGSTPSPSGFAVLSSGMMRPKNTLLAAFGLTHRRQLAEAYWRRHSCSWCSLDSCGLRRAAFRPESVEQ